MGLLISKRFFKTFLFLLFYLLFFIKSSNASTLFEDDFNDNYVGSDWSINNFDPVILGSKSVWGQLYLSETNNQIQIQGVDSILENTQPGWFGKSLITKNTFPANSQFSVESQVNINNAIKGYLVFLNIEFDQENRILLSIGNHKYDGQNHWPVGAQLIIQEQGVTKCANGVVNLESVVIDGCRFIPLNIELNRNYNLRIEVNPISKTIFAYIDNQLIYNETYGGNIEDFKSGIAAAVRYDDDFIDSRFDNFIVSYISPKFDLPFNYENRLNATKIQFISSYSKRVTAVFDHVFKGGLFKSYLGIDYKQKDCKKGTLGLTCYDSHNGTDFDDDLSGQVLSVGQGKVIFTSDHNKNTCIPNIGGFGCVVIVEYPENGVFGLYAHLNAINVEEGEAVTVDSLLGYMGNTGCPKCGIHLHFGVLKPINNTTNKSLHNLTREDFKNFLYEISPSFVQVESPSYPAFCSYKAPNKQSFSFQDPSGWFGNEIDPWSLPKNEGGCGVVSPNLWKYELVD